MSLHDKNYQNFRISPQPAGFETTLRMSILQKQQRGGQKKVTPVRLSQLQASQNDWRLGVHEHSVSAVLKNRGSGGIPGI